MAWTRQDLAERESSASHTRQGLQAPNRARNLRSSFDEGASRSSLWLASFRGKAAAEKRVEYSLDFEAPGGESNSRVSSLLGADHPLGE